MSRKLEMNSRCQGKSLSAALALVRMLKGIPAHKQAVITKDKGALFVRIEPKTETIGHSTIIVDDWINK